MGAQLNSCIKVVFGEDEGFPTVGHGYDVVDPSKASDRAPTELRSIPLIDCPDPLAKQGWIYYISRASLVPIKSKLPLSSLSDTSNVVIVLALSGASVKPGILAFPYGITIKGHSVAAELDAGSLAYQKDWMTALRNAIEAANVSALSDGTAEKIPGVMDWYSEKLRLRQEAIGRLRQGTPMKKHFLSPLGGRRDHDRVLSIDEKAEVLSWVSEQSSKDSSDKGVTIDSIEEIIEGTRTKVLTSLTTDPARAACCWSVVTAQRTYDFEAHCVPEKERWVDNLRCILQVAKLEAAIKAGRRKGPRRSHQIVKSSHGR